MVEKYFALKLIDVYVGVGYFVILTIGVIGVAVVKSIRLNRKIKLLEKNGFKKYLRGVPSVGGGAFYGWKRESDDKIITDYDIEWHSYKELKKWIEVGAFK